MAGRGPASIAANAEYDTIAEVKAAVGIPVIANGDIDSPQKAKYVLDYTGADGVMIGRAAQGRPWIFREIEHFLNTGTMMPPPLVSEIHGILRDHLQDLYAFYGLATGVKIARKHIGWYTKGLAGAAQFRFAMNQIDDAETAGGVHRSILHPAGQRSRQAALRQTCPRNSPHEPEQHRGVRPPHAGALFF